MSITGGNGSVPLFSLYGAAGILEVVGGVLLLLGLFTRPTAFILSGQMAVAYFLIHAKAEDILFPLINNGELALLYSVVFFLMVFIGSGAFALDNKLGKKA